MATANVDKIRERALEVGVYLPLGAYAAAREGLAELTAERVRSRVRRTFDDLVARGHDRARPVETRLRRASNRVEQRFERGSQRARRAARGTVRKGRAAATTVAPTLPRVAAPKHASELPIDDYDSLTANEVVEGTKGLTQTDRARVYKYELDHEARSTVLKSLESRFEVLPIPTYDELTVDEITWRLEALPQDQVRKLRDYEAATKNRQTVIDKADSLLR